MPNMSWTFLILLQIFCNIYAGYAFSALSAHVEDVDHTHNE